MKIAYLGSGTWGIALAKLLSEKGHDVVVWSINEEQINHLNENSIHPNFPDILLPSQMKYTLSLEEALFQADYIVESVTSKGVRPVAKLVKKLQSKPLPFLITSKGIEQKTGLLLPEVALDELGKEWRTQIGCISGPSHAEEVIKNSPTSLSCASFDSNLVLKITELFNNDYLRVYPNRDINGVCFGGAMKNIIAIACGISDGMGFGDNTKAALITRGLHEIKKLSVVKNCNPDTLNGLSGMGDLCVTCLSTLSRNYTFGNLLAKGNSIQQAKESIGMVVEGAYCCISAIELAKKSNIPLPISQSVYSIIEEGGHPVDIVKSLLDREIKEEHL